MEGIEKLAQLCSILGDATRLRMAFTLLDEGEKSVGDLAQQVSSSISNVSNHLRLMRYENIVSVRKHGKQIFYSLSEPKIENLLYMLRTFIYGPVANENPNQGNSQHGL
jgi:DNA-binding transcriptional ArsR family regulator